MNSQRTNHQAPISPVASHDDDEMLALAGRRTTRKRELLYLGSALLVGFIVLPLAIYLVGTLTLGPYAGGKSMGAFFAEFFAHLGQGAPRTWFIALSPYLAVWVVRLTFRRNPWSKKPLVAPPESEIAPRADASNTRREPFISP